MLNIRGTIAIAQHFMHTSYLHNHSHLYIRTVALPSKIMPKWLRSAHERKSSYISLYFRLHQFAIPLASPLRSSPSSWSSSFVPILASPLSDLTLPLPPRRLHYLSSDPSSLLTCQCGLLYCGTKSLHQRGSSLSSLNVHGRSFYSSARTSTSNEC